MLTLLTVSSGMCDEIAALRRKLRRVPRGHLMFLDETAERTSATPTHTITLPGEKPFVLATNTTAYAARWDMIAAVVEDRVLVPKIYSPKVRKRAKVKGINGPMLLQYIDDYLAQAVEGLNRYPITLVLDKATIHKNTADILQAFRDRGSYSITSIELMPTQAAKRLSPLDNAMFHDWKEENRKHAPLTETNIARVMNDNWEKMNPQPHYKHCGLKRDRSEYFDCPAPSEHNHGK
jgi:hypothetical protein